MTDNEIIELFHTEKSLQEVRDVCRVRYATIAKLWKQTFGEDAYTERKRLHYRDSKLGTKNPMKGKTGSEHPNWIDSERISDRHGYVRVKAPMWYTGKIYDGYADGHIISYCESRNLTEVPQGFCVHHLDLDKQNNRSNNLIMLTTADHTMLHAWITRTIVQRLSREGVG